MVSPVWSNHISRTSNSLVTMSCISGDISSLRKLRKQVLLRGCIRFNHACFSLSVIVIRRKRQDKMFREHQQRPYIPASFDTLHVMCSFLGTFLVALLSRSDSMRPRLQ